jgi:xanthine/uracil permease
MVRYLITIALFAHGIGHLLFLTNSWGIWKGGDEGRSWLF